MSIPYIFDSNDISLNIANDFDSIESEYYCTQSDVDEPYDNTLTQINASRDLNYEMDDFYEADAEDAYNQSCLHELNEYLHL
jgi:hypothetical protein